ncbi:MAG: threonine/serine exporter family protein, partial [Clostridiales bacterium]|nr:threonine/serine exporter family protein [Clostridiales bacterium]
MCHSVEYLNMGNAMLLIPGIAFTNGIRDMFNGDLISGLFRFLEALLLGITIAVGFVFVKELWG